MHCKGRKQNCNYRYKNKTKQKIQKNNFTTSSLLSLIFRIQKVAQIIDDPNASEIPNGLEKLNEDMLPLVDITITPVKPMSNATMSIDFIFCFRTSEDRITITSGHV